MRGRAFADSEAAARWALTALVVAGLLVVGVFLTTGVRSPVAAPFRIVALVSAAALGAIGIVGFGIAAVRSIRSGSTTERIALVAAIVIGLPLLAVAVLVTGFMAQFAAGLVLGWIVLGVAAAWPLDPDPETRATSPGIPARLGLRGTAVAAALAVSGTATLGALHVLVWNPLAKVPGNSLAGLYAVMTARGESPAWPAATVGVWASGWLALSLVFLAVAVVGRRGVLSRLDPRRIARTALVAVAGIGLSTWSAGFGMGMSIADAFATSGGDAAVTGPLLSVIGVAAGIAAAVRIIPAHPNRSGGAMT